MKSTAFCFDLDGTITSQEILPLISREIGLHEEINLLTQITLKGLIPFETSFKLRVKLLSQIPIPKIREIVSKVQLETAICDFIRENREHCYVVTGNLDVWVGDFIKNKLQCQYFSSKADYDNGTLLGINTILDKGTAVESLRNNYSRIVAIGDSMNDCSMFEKADIGVAYGGVHNPVESLIKISDYLVYEPVALANLLKNYTHEC